MLSVDGSSVPVVLNDTARVLGAKCSAGIGKAIGSLGLVWLTLDGAILPERVIGFCYDCGESGVFACQYCRGQAMQGDTVLVFRRREAYGIGVFILAEI